MTREAYIRDLVLLGVPYSTIDAILQYSGNQPNLQAYSNLRKLLDCSGQDTDHPFKHPACS